MKNILFLFFLSLSATAHAAISLGQTRVIYNEDDKAATFDVINNADQPYMVQTWLDTGNADKTPANLPLLVTPPIIKLEANKRAVLRTIYQGEGLSQHQESVFWVNVQEIPMVSSKTNSLQLAQRIRIKLFYRPSGLQVTLPQAVQQLRWECSNTRLTAINDTPLHISLTEVELAGRHIDADMVDPHARRTFALPEKGQGKMAFSWVDDYGAVNRVDNVAVSCQ